VDEGEYPFYVRSQSPERSSRYLFDGEAVLTAGDGAGVGKVFHYVRGKFDAHQRVYVLRNFRTVSGRYFFYCFKALFSITALDGSAKSTVDSVRRHMISDMNIPVTPAETQAEIVKEIQSAEDSTELLVTKIREQVSLLQERRQALITAAVTGQLEI
jgi:type I restriction enzyme S subunit